MTSEPGGFAQRPSWVSAPGALRRQVELICGAAVVAGNDVHGGMSPGPAAVLGLDDGRSVFVKAVSRQASVGSHRAYVREAATLAALPAHTPAPTLIGSADVDGWLALVMTVADGEPAGPPWTSRGVRLVASACGAIAVIPAPSSLPMIGELLTDLDGWHTLADGAAGPLDEWERSHATALARLAAGWRDWTAGEALVHQDVRADNAALAVRTGACCSAPDSCVDLNGESLRLRTHRGVGPERRVERRLDVPASALTPQVTTSGLPAATFQRTNSLIPATAVELLR